MIAAPCSAPQAIPTATAARNARITGFPASALAPTAKRLSSPPFET